MNFASPSSHSTLTPADNGRTTQLVIFCTFTLTVVLPSREKYPTPLSLLFCGFAFHLCSLFTFTLYSSSFSSSMYTSAPSYFCTPSETDVIFTTPFFSAELPSSTSGLRSAPLSHAKNSVATNTKTSATAKTTILFFNNVYV